MPLATPAPAPALGQGPQIGQILLLLLYLALIFAGAYFVTRFFARSLQRGSILPIKGGGSFRPGRHIRLVDRLVLDREKSILLFDAEGKRYLVGVSENAFALLESGEAPPEEEAAAAPQSPIPFRDIFAAWKRREEDTHGSQE